MKKLLLILTLFLFIGCESNPITPEPTPIPLNYYDGEWVFVSQPHGVSFIKIVIKDQLLIEVYSEWEGEFHKSNSIVLIRSTSDGMGFIYEVDAVRGHMLAIDEIKTFRIAITFHPYDEYQIKLDSRPCRRIN